MKNTLSRRAFLRSSADLARGSCVVLSMPMILAACDQARNAQRNASDFTTLTAEEAVELEAIAARIIPSDDSPGAREAGVVYFLDKVLGAGRDAELQIVRTGLVELQAAGATTFSVATFHQLTSAQQDQLLTTSEDSEFFATMRYLTVAGMFALPEYGGNKDGVGFQLIGFEQRHVWQPPFGFYDADHMTRGE